MNQNLNLYLILGIVIVYFVGLLVIAYFTSKNADNNSFFIGNKKSKWWLVAFGMIGTSLSGVTFISVPGTVGKMTDGTFPFQAFEYFQIVIGYFLGYFVVAFVLLPIYYKMNLTSIYTYLDNRFNKEAHKTGSLYFIISRSIGATARLYLVINVLQLFLFDRIGIPFYITTLIILLMILLYTYEGGVKTIVITDTLQTTFMLISLIACIFFILNQLNFSIVEGIQALSNQNYDHIFNYNFSAPSFFLKSIVGGMFITIAMTGLDQEMMQKNISVKNLYDSKKNMLTFASIMVFVNFLFLFLGGLLYIFAQSKGGKYITETVTENGKESIKKSFQIFDTTKNEIVNLMGDDLFPTMALHGFFPILIAIIFIIGLVSALFPSADGALTSLTSSFCVDILGIQKDELKSEATKKKTRIRVHLAFTMLFFILIMIFKIINDKSIIYFIMDLAGYTYGPLLGLFAFGILTKRHIEIPNSIFIVCLLSPLFTYLLKNYLFPVINYNVGLELIVLNGLLTFLGLFIVSKK